MVSLSTVTSTKTREMPSQVTPLVLTLQMNGKAPVKAMTPISSLRLMTSTSSPCARMAAVTTTATRVSNLEPTSPSPPAPHGMMPQVPRTTSPPFQDSTAISTVTEKPSAASASMPTTITMTKTVSSLILDLMLISKNLPSAMPASPAKSK